MARALVVLFVATLLAAIVFWFYADHYQALRDVSQLADNLGDLSLEGDLNADLSLESVELTHAGEGALSWTLIADRASYSVENDLIRVERPVITYMHTDTDQPVTVSALEGEVRQDDRGVRLWNEVLVRYEDKSVGAESLVYDDETQTLVMEGGVVFKSERVTCFSPLMTVDLATNRLTLEQGVQAEIYLEAFALHGQEEQGNQ